VVGSVAGCPCVCVPVHCNGQWVTVVVPVIPPFQLEQKATVEAVDLQFDFDTLKDGIILGQLGHDGIMKGRSEVRVVEKARIRDQLFRFRFCGTGEGIGEQFATVHAPGALKKGGANPYLIMNRHASGTSDQLTATTKLVSFAVSVSVAFGCRGRNRRGSHDGRRRGKVVTRVQGLLYSSLDHFVASTVVHAGIGNVRRKDSTGFVRIEGHHGSICYHGSKKVQEMSHG